MLKKEFYMKRQDGVNLYRTYSDEDYRIRQIETGNIYDEAIDVEDSQYTYEETDEKIVRLDATVIEDEIIELEKEVNI